MPKLPFLAGLGATLMLALAPVSGRAATVTLDLASLGNVILSAGQTKTVTLGASTTVSGGITTSVSGLQVTLAAMSYADSRILTSHSGGQRTIRNFTTSGMDATVTPSALNFNESGAGVTNPQDSFLGISLDSPNINAGFGYTDFIEILLSQPATLNSADFTNYSAWGTGHLVWASDTTGDGSIGNGDIISAATRLTGGGVSFNSSRSSAFLIGASGYNSDWRLASVTLSYTPTVASISAVPLPASGLLLLAALGGFGMLARRRRC